MPGIDPDALGFLAADISRLIRVAMDRGNAASDIAVTPGEARVLAYAARSGPVRQNQLAAEIGVEAMTLTGYLDQLEAKGIVAREPDPTDRRAKIVTLTPEADTILDQIGATGQAIRASASTGFTPAEWDALKDGLRRVRANLIVHAGDAK